MHCRVPVKPGSSPTHHHADADHCIKLARLGHGLGHHGQLKAARHPAHLQARAGAGRRWASRAPLRRCQQHCFSTVIIGTALANRIAAASQNGGGPGADSVASRHAGATATPLPARAQPALPTSTLASSTPWLWNAPMQPSSSSLVTRSLKRPTTTPNFMPGLATTLPWRTVTPWGTARAATDARRDDLDTDGAENSETAPAGAMCGPVRRAGRTSDRPPLRPLTLLPGCWGGDHGHMNACGAHGSALAPLLRALLLLRPAAQLHDCWIWVLCWRRAMMCVVRYTALETVDKPVP